MQFSQVFFISEFMCIKILLKHFCQTTWIFDSRSFARIFKSNGIWHNFMRIGKRINLTILETSRISIHFQFTRYLFMLYQGVEEVSIHCETISPIRGFLVNVLVNIFSFKKKAIRNAVLSGIRTQTLRHWSRVSVPIRHRPTPSCVNENVQWRISDVKSTIKFSTKSTNW